MVNQISSEAMTSIGIGEVFRQLIEGLPTIIDVELIPTEEMLKEFEQYLSRQRSNGWIFDPTGYQKALQDEHFEKAQRRVDLLRLLRKVLDDTKTLKD